MNQQELWQAARQSFQTQARDIGRLADTVDEAEFFALVERLHKCREQNGRIVLSACGTSAQAARKIAHALCCLEHSAAFIPPSDALHGAIGFLKENDVLLLFSKAGQSDELDLLLKIGKSKNATVAAVVSKRESDLARMADMTLFVPIERESDPFASLPTTSILNLLSIFDAVCSTLIVMEGYQLSQLGAVHPGGAVGKRLG